MKKAFILFLGLFLLSAIKSTAESGTFACRVSITGGSNTVCLGQPVVLIANTYITTDEILRIEWYRNRESLGGPNQSHIRLNTSYPDSANILLSVADVHGAQTRCSVMVVILPTPTLEVSKHFSWFQRLFSRSPIPVLRVNTSAANSIQWFHNDIILPGATRARFRATEAGKYKVRVKCPSGCYGFGETIVVD